MLFERNTLLRALQSPRDAQRQVLASLLAANAGTSFGVEHGFKRIRDWKDFRAAVPIRDYAVLAPWIDRVAGGEHNVLSADDPVVYFMSSGSTGDSKKIPITREFMRTGFFPPFYAAWANFTTWRRHTSGCGWRSNTTCAALSASTRRWSRRCPINSTNGGRGS